MEALDRLKRRSCGEANTEFLYMSLTTEQAISEIIAEIDDGTRFGLVIQKYNDKGCRPGVCLEAVQKISAHKLSLLTM